MKNDDELNDDELNESLAKILGFKEEYIPGFGTCWRWPKRYRDYQASEPSTCIPDFLMIIERTFTAPRLPIQFGFVSEKEKYE